MRVHRQVSPAPSHRWLSALILAALMLRGEAADPPYFVYVSGSAPHAGGGAPPDDTSDNIECFHFDPATATMTLSSKSAGGNGPGYLAWSPDRTHLYAINSKVTGITGGAVAAFRIDAVTGRLTRLNAVSSKGTGVTHLCMHPSGKWVFAANYSSGHVASIPIVTDPTSPDYGKVAEAVDFELAGANAHMALTNAAGTRLYVPCLGDEHIAIFQIDAMGQLSGKTLTLMKTNPTDTSKWGPRHMAFDHDETHAYVINELASTMTTFAHDPASGVLTSAVTVAALPAGYVGTSKAAHVAMSKDGATLYGSNRRITGATSSVVSYRVDAPSGALSSAQHVTGSGELEHPRDFTVDPTGVALLAASRGDDGATTAKWVNRFRIIASTGPDNGRLTYLGKTAVANRPDFVGVMPKVRVLTSLQVTPATAALAITGTRDFDVQGIDQCGDTLATAPTVTWTITSGPGSIIAATGVYTATAHGTATVRATDGVRSATATVTISNQAPTVKNAVQATPTPVTGLTTSLSVLGQDDLPESALIYAWSTVGTPPASVIFAATGTNAAKTTTATFTAAGSYQVRATITDGNGASVSGTLTFTVNQTYTSLTVTPIAPTVTVGATQAFSATRRDQFGAAIASGGAPPTWTVTTGGGSITAGGVYTAPSTAGSATITAATGGKVAPVTITVAAAGGGGGSGGGDGGGGGGGCGLGGGAAALALIPLLALRLRLTRRLHPAGAGPY